jgi:hypothetical protein
VTAGLHWWHRDLTRYQPPPNRLRPDAEGCFCCGSTGDEFKPGWLECRECDVTWYGGTVPLVLSNGVRGIR